MFGADITHATGDHDRLVVAADLAIKFCLERPEIAADIGSSEFIVECGAADGRLDHNVQG